MTYFAIGGDDYRQDMYRLLDTTEVNAVVIDVKGDLPNLLLTFPNFEPSLLEPWLELEQEGMSPEQIAAQEPLRQGRLPRTDREVDLVRP